MFWKGQLMLRLGPRACVCVCVGGRRDGAGGVSKGLAVKGQVKDFGF